MSIATLLISCIKIDDGGYCWKDTQDNNQQQSDEYVCTPLSKTAWHPRFVLYCSVMLFGTMDSSIILVHRIGIFHFFVHETYQMHLILHCFHAHTITCSHLGFHCYCLRPSTSTIGVQLSFACHGQPCCGIV
jgi:hypothetical protein